VTAAGEALDFRRILVALDASKESLAALEAAAGLAAQLDAQITGLFIEDADLLNLAALPFSREAPALSRSGRLLEPERLAREFKSMAATARQALARMAEASHLQWSFRTTRGRIGTELLAAAREADLVAVGKGTRPLSGQIRLGQHTRTVATQTTCSMLIASSVSSPADAPLAAVYDGAAPAHGALALAARLSERDGRRLLVFVLGDSPATFARHEIAVREQLRALGVSAAIRRVRGTGLADVVRAVRTEPAALLVVGAPAVPSDEGAALDMLVEQSSCTVLVVRR
jgi:nucleotide-binding universal stress UspA family protein